MNGLDTALETELVLVRLTVTCAGNFEIFASCASDVLGAFEEL
ncbi:hypothetical protein C8N44_1346 [Allosediminivita pacifica]|uniref:Uncharacterized protein n=1 Tax=Allosediminivita pacifica TaxID=1267769 RepID=A0A2T6A941_9RHOB|nr:hypothetical protein C8N44_1346 [Allosediminivita pacifica]